MPPLLARQDDAAPPATQADTDYGSGGGLTTAQIGGVVAAIVVAVSLAACVIGFRRRRQRQRASRRRRHPHSSRSSHRHRGRRGRHIDRRRGRQRHRQAWPANTAVSSYDIDSAYYARCYDYAYDDHGDDDPPPRLRRMSPARVRFSPAVKEVDVEKGEAYGYPAYSTVPRTS